MSVGTVRAEDLWQALASPWRRRLLDLLREGPRTTGDLADAIPELSRFAVMQHLGVLTRAGAVVGRRRGRNRYHHLNPVPLRRWYERWVLTLADVGAAEMLALQRTVEQKGEPSVATAIDELRTVRIETELNLRATPERVFRALTEEVRSWFPHTYGGERVQAVVIEPLVGGRHYEDWGDGSGHLYGHVTVYDPPRRLGLRGRIMPGTILDTAYELEGGDDDTVLLRMSKVAAGPMTEEEAASVRTYGDIARFADALRALVEG